jgi:hypothetical protein
MDWVVHTTPTSTKETKVVNMWFWILLLFIFGLGISPMPWEGDYD